MIWTDERGDLGQDLVLFGRQAIGAQSAPPLQLLAQEIGPIHRRDLLESFFFFFYRTNGEAQVGSR